MWKHQHPSIFYTHQPAGGSNLSQLQLTSIKLQLDREPPTSSLSQKKNTCWFTLDISSVLYLLLCCSSNLISDLHHLCSAPSSSLLSSSSFTFFLQLAYSLQLSLILLHTLFFSHSFFFFVDIHPLDIILFYTKIASWLFVFHWEFEMGSHVSFPSAFSSPFISLLINYNCRCQF